MQDVDFQLITRQLYKMGPDEILRRYVLEHEQPMILNKAHAGVAGGHYGGKSIVHNIFQAGLWWPTLHADAREYCRNYGICQRLESHRDEMKCLLTLQAFEKWFVYFVGCINPQGKRTGARYIITVMDYLTRWTEIVPVKDCTVATIAKFLFNNVVARFKCLNILISDQGTRFVNHFIKELNK